jgi:serine/threonine-protein kinase
MSDTKPPVAESPHEADLSGRQLGGYRLLRRLGKGAMAEVYLAEQVSLGRQVAIKVLKRSLATDATYVERFQQEARAAAKLVHANIVQIYEVGYADGVHFIAQEYVQGVNLAELMARRGPPELARMLSIVRQVAAALSKAAEHGIVHRDIKPENIMLSAAGEVKVADFGLARLNSRDEAANLTQVGITMGTPLYMSPEQVEGKPLDSASDIYSLGVMSYEMLAGEPPFRGETALAIAVQHLHSQPPRLENVRADVPSAVCRIVHAMLAKNPAERYATPRQLLNELRGLSIELFQEDPGEADDAWQDDLRSTAEARREATDRLAEAMKTTSMPAVRRSTAWLGTLVVAGAFAAGLAGAWIVRQRPLVVAAPVDPAAIPRHETAESQYLYAMMLGTEQGWQSVPYYFGEANLYARRAQEQLALLYLRERDYARAMALFEKFASYSDVEVELKAFGLAGAAIVLNREKRFNESAARLAELFPLRNKLDGEMRALIEIMLRDRRLPGDPGSLRQWRRWFETAPPQRPESAAGRTNADRR